MAEGDTVVDVDRADVDCHGSVVGGTFPGGIVVGVQGGHGVVGVVGLAVLDDAGTGEDDGGGDGEQGSELLLE